MKQMSYNPHTCTVGAPENPYLSHGGDSQLQASRIKQPLKGLGQGRHSVRNWVFQWVFNIADLSSW